MIAPTMTTEELRRRMRAAMTGVKLQDSAVRHSDSAEPVLRCYNVDSTSENGVTTGHACNTDSMSKNNAVTPLNRFSSNSDSQPEKPCVQCSTADEPLHSHGSGCKVEIVELPQAHRYRKTFAFLQLKAPALVTEARWKLCVRDGSRFLAKWGDQAEALGWSSADLFGLHQPPEKPHPSYSRLSRYDCTGLCWLLQGRPVVAVTEATASIRNPTTGNTTVFRKNNKPGFGPVGDSLEDFR